MIIYGKNVIKEAVLNRRPIYKLYVDEKTTDQKMLYFLKDHHMTYEIKTKNELNHLTERALHQGFVADVKPYAYFDLESILKKDEIQRFVILDGVEDPHNLGAILRTAEAAGFDGILMSKKNQVPLNATVAKVSTGSIEHVPVILVSNINQAILSLQAKDVLVVGTDGQTEKTFKDIPLDRSLAIVLGNEGEGIRPLVKKNCDLLVKIPMKGKINSLNVSVAAGIMMYATLK